jgi:hypothetical protein
VKLRLTLWLLFLTKNSAVVLTRMLLTDILFYSQLVKLLNMNSIFLLISVMVELSILIMNSWLALLKIFGKVVNPNSLISKLIFLLDSTLWLLLVLNHVVMVKLLGDSELMVVNGKNSILLILTNNNVLQLLQNLLKIEPVVNKKF